MRIRAAKNCAGDDFEWLGMPKKHRPSTPFEWVGRAGGKIDMPVFVVYYSDILRVTGEMKKVSEALKLSPALSSRNPVPPLASSSGSQGTDYSFEVSITSVKVMIASAPPFNVFDEYHLSSLQESVILFAEKIALKGTQASKR